MNPRPRRVTACVRVSKSLRVCAGLPGACLLAGFLAAPAVWAQDGPAADVSVEAPPIAPAPATTRKDPFNEERIMKVMPDYQTVRDPRAGVQPLTNHDKWLLAWKETVDPFNVASAALAAGLSQAAQQTPKYGVGVRGYSERFGAAVGDFGTQNFFSAGVYSVLFHQDPRYFRKGPSSHIPARVGYALKALVVCHNDAGKAVFNSSGLLGMVTGIAASNLYYPAASRTGEVMVGRIQTSLFGGVVGNLTSEFWPDLEKKFFHHKQSQPQSTPDTASTSTR